MQITESTAEVQIWPSFMTIPEIRIGNSERHREYGLNAWERKETKFLKQLNGTPWKLQWKAE